MTAMMKKRDNNTPMLLLLETIGVISVQIHYMFKILQKGELFFTFLWKKFTIYAAIKNIKKFAKSLLGG